MLGPVAHPKAWAEETCPPGRTICSGPPAAISPLWSSVPPAQVRARQRAARRASSSLMVATRKAEQSAWGKGQAYMPTEPPEGGRGRRAQDEVGAPGHQENSCGGSEGLLGNIDSGYLGAYLLLL